MVPATSENISSGRLPPQLEAFRPHCPQNKAQSHFAPQLSGRATQSQQNPYISQTRKFVHEVWAGFVKERRKKKRKQVLHSPTLPSCCLLPERNHTVSRNSCTTGEGVSRWTLVWEEKKERARRSVKTSSARWTTRPNKVASPVKSQQWLENVSRRCWRLQQVVSTRSYPRSTAQAYPAAAL